MPGLRGISVSEFRAAATKTPNNEGGVSLQFTDDVERDEFLRKLEEYFADRRFTNAADAFDTVKAYALDLAGKR